MLKLLKKIKETTFRKTNFKAFSLFLLLSIIIWILIQFSKTYQKIIEIPVIYQEHPKDKIITKKKDVIAVKITNTGFGLTKLAINKPSLTIPLNELPERKSNLYFLVDKNKVLIENQLTSDLKSIVYLTDTLKIPFQQKAVKKVPVISAIKTKYAAGFSSKNGIQLSPDSIKVIGEQDYLEKINFVSTKPKTLVDLNQSKTANIAIEKPKFKNIEVAPEKIAYSIDVQKFTEGELAIPVTIINAPPETEISFFPKEVVVIFSVPLEYYQEIDKTDFKVVCDYSAIIGNQDFLIPKLTKKPEVITNFRLNTNKVQFVIKKQ